MANTPIYGLKVYDVTTLDKTKAVKELFNDDLGNQPNSNIFKIENLIKASNDEINKLKSSQGIKLISATLSSSSGDLDTYTSNDDLEAYINEMVILLSVDTTNVQTSCIQINNLAFLYFKKYNITTNLLENLSANDLKKDVLYFYQIRTTTNELILVGECPNDYCTKNEYNTLVQGVSDAFFNISNGNMSVGDSDKLGGQLPEYYAKETDLDNHVNDSDIHLTTTEKTELHTHTNKTILDNTTASFTSDYETKLNGINVPSDAKFKPETDTYSTLSTTNKTIIGAINENFSFVSNGKSLIASAITDKGVSTLATDTFATMASNIGSITTGYPIGTNGLITGDVVIPDSVTSLGDYAFYRQSVTSVSGGNNVTTLGVYCFQYATSLITASLPNATTFGSSCFQNATSLTTIDISKAISIGYFLCYNAPLTHLTVTSTANSIALVGTSSSYNDYSAWKLPVADMVAFGNALKTASLTTGIKFGATYWNALSTEQKAIFTSKNYTITAV